MDAEGAGHIVHRRRRAGMLAVVVVVQNLLVIACLVVTLYVYWDFPKRGDFQKTEKKDVVHARFPAIDGYANGTLKLNRSYTSHKMDLDADNETIGIQCTGPYILYLELCYQAQEEGNNILQLQLKEEKDPVTFFLLRNVTRSLVCEKLHRIIYLQDQDQASMHIYSSAKFKIQNMTMGLSYLLGTDDCS